MTTGPPPSSHSARLDGELVRRGLARSRSHARQLVGDGSVRIDGALARKPSAVVLAVAQVQVWPPDPGWVGRGAGKLLAALERFGPRGLQVRGRRCLDVGAGTGGFTEVLLTGGAAQVVALDVGHGQLAASLTTDPRVEQRDGVNIREVRPADLGEPFGVVVVDVSFVSLTLVIGVVAPLVAADGDAVLLVKPQFEIGPGRVGKRGVVRSRSDRLEALTRVCRQAGRAGLGVVDLIPSPVRGTAGNQEYLVWLTPSEGGRLTAQELERRIAGMEQP